MLANDFIDKRQSSKRRSQNDSPDFVKKITRNFIKEFVEIILYETFTFNPPVRKMS